MTTPSGVRSQELHIFENYSDMCCHFHFRDPCRRMPTAGTLTCD